MEPWASIISTLLWVGLIGLIVWRFERPIHALLSAIARRLEAGSGIKVGGFELSEIAKPQLPQEQKEKLEKEVYELEQVTPRTDLGRKSLQSMYMQAEDLALRALQQEYNAMIHRKVTFGPGINVDAAFESGGVTHIVEVKYSIHKISKQVVRNALRQISKYYSRSLLLSGAKYLVVLVSDQGNTDMNDKDFASLLSEYPFDVEIRSYSLTDLAARFGGADE